VTLSDPRVWRLLHFAGTVKLLLSPGKAGGLPKGNYLKSNAAAASINLMLAAAAFDFKKRMRDVAGLFFSYYSASFSPTA
jgi:hypothetical protein